MTLSQPNAAHIVIVGATSAIAEHCARLWALRQPERITLVGRDVARLERIAADLAVRAPKARIEVLSQGDANDPQNIEAVVSRAAAELPADIALIAHGLLPDQALCQQDIAAGGQALALNGISPVLYAEAFVRSMQQAGRGTVAVIGSVAGDRGRKSNYVYGAAKALVTRYVQGLQHRLALEGSPVCAILIKPGPTDTPMTAHLKAEGARLAPVDRVAKAIVGAIDRGQPVAYVPGKWALIMLVIRHLPRFLFNKMDI
ncbi:SDR family NAD(P)-dependent oxidoreductase [Ottowia testudinis]|uniref:SDR family NAD(P)-dependent oxidoreductase n=1 Tax=Ottowia testudinis TaxID=2816950 RepID=A0A975H4N3_9BURK|nr:SDR family NAD(P)-dependent oxidoreductase [Ottowia testudinis]QTD47044.1 SDR family NAD(P)-dependent oxidoreductase [Ottowia testudinis]